jgi:uncharacterized RmlC-like cupin family protein
MEAPSETFRIVRAAPDPTSEAGRGMFASLFDEQPDSSALRTFPFALPAGTHLTTHRHTAGLAAGITRGRMVFVFGADGTDRVDLEAGDYVWIREGVMHDEETHDEGAEMIVASLEPFETLED